MGKIGFWFGRLRRVYVGLYRDYLYDKARHERIHSTKVIKFLTMSGYLVSGGCLIKQAAEYTPREEQLAKRIALTTMSDKVHFKKNGSVVISKQYLFLNRNTIMNYVIYPIILLIGLIAIILI